MTSPTTILGRTQPGARQRPEGHAAAGGTPRSEPDQHRLARGSVDRPELMTDRVAAQICCVSHQIATTSGARALKEGPSHNLRLEAPCRRNWVAGESVLLSAIRRERSAPKAQQAPSERGREPWSWEQLESRRRGSTTYATRVRGAAPGEQPTRVRRTWRRGIVEDGSRPDCERRTTASGGELPASDVSRAKRPSAR